MQVARQLEHRWHQSQHMGKALLLVVAQCGVHLNVILNQHNRNRAFGKGRFLLCDKLIKRGLAHWDEGVPSRGDWVLA